MVTHIGAIQVRPLTLDDATEEIAAGVICAELDAYVGRFGEQYRQDLAERLCADPQNPVHLAWTLGIMKKGPSDGCYWVVALEQVDGATVVCGFAVCEVNSHEIFLADIHTHPSYQRRGIATALVDELLRFVCNGPQAAIVADLPVTLNVARERLHDRSEHPFAWYLAIGFVVDGGPEGEFFLNERTLPMIHMQAAPHHVRAKLRIDRSVVVD